MQQREKSITLKKDYNVIDLFAGCGGFSQGFKLEGFNVVAANEIWDPAIETYRHNHKETMMIEGDITLKKIKKKIYDSVKNRKIDVIIGGPPCQAYSVSGNRNPDDPRGQLYLDFLEIVNQLKPKIFVMENVKGLKNMKHVNPNLSKRELEKFKENCSKLQRYKDLKRYRAQRKLEENEEIEFNLLENNIKTIKKEINHNMVPLIDKIMAKVEEINYKADWKILNAADYGIPQTRQRIFFIGTKNKEFSIGYPIKTHHKPKNQISLDKYSDKTSQKCKKKWLTSGDLLIRYENWKENEEKNHIFTKHSQKFINKLHDTPLGETLYKNYSDAWRRLDPDKPAKTVKENHGGVFIHYKFDRVCTPRELAALQSFDDGFLFKGTKSSILKQIGNAVPPLLARALAKKIKIDLNQICNYDDQMKNTTNK